ncbi:MAG: AAA family ATPase, partial [Pirellulaceae bacterium]
MLLSIPIYVDVRRTQGVQVHHCRPLLFPGPGADDPQLGKALTKLQRRLKPYLDARGRMERHDELSLCAWSPDLETHVLKTTIPLRDRTARCKLLWVVLRSLERRVAFAPALPHLWLEVSANERLEDRVQECLTQYFRDEEKNSGPYGTPIRPENLALQGQAWVSSVAIDVQTRMPDLKQQERQLAALFDETRMDGGVELQRVGRCLDWLYPTELPEAIERTAEVDQLDRLFTLPDRRPVVVVGPRLAGKSTVISACVRRRVQRRPRPFLPRHNVWLLSPQRLISGMMYVGQWEGRLQAILREAQRRKHVLYFDDFLGLYRAGLSRDASLSVADVLKPYIIRRDVRVLAEMTSEAWQVLQERDRGLADQFHVVRVSPTGPEATLRIMLEIHRQLEAEHSVEFDLDALPALVDLFGAYVRDTSFPGKTAVFSRQLARKRSGRTITREAVQEDFHQQTGLSLVLLDDRQRLDRDEAARQLRTRIVGQHEAIQAAAEVVAVTKARLSDPARPLATWLFLGPTGVGKTQCAKALAEVLFSDESRLLRFDMNEFVTPQAVAQLIGTFDEPDGLLTAAVRRQPFSVVLLDEIEK